MPANGQPGVANDGTPVVWVESLGRAVAATEAKKFGVKPLTAPQGGAGRIDPATFSRSRDTVSAIDDAKKRTNWFRSGWLGGVTAEIPGSPSYNLDKDLDTLKARTAFEELAAMRRSSPTGGALGAISEGEMRLLQASEANLDVAQSEGQIDKNLGRMRRTATLRTPGLDPSNPLALTEENRATVPEGAYFRGPDGRVYQHKPGAGPAGGPAGSGALKSDPRAVQAARDAIRRGAPRAAVIKRLRDNGINPAGL
jgi:hypothetical protein